MNRVLGAYITKFALRPRFCLSSAATQPPCCVLLRWEKLGSIPTTFCMEGPGALKRSAA